MSRHANPILEATLNTIGNITGRGTPNVVDDNVPAPIASSQRSAPAEGIVASTKGSGYLGVEDQTSGASALNPKAQLGLFHKIRRQSDWARFVSYVPVSENSGQLDLWTDENFRMHAVTSEGPRTNIPLHKPDLEQVTFSTKTLSGAFGLRLKAIKAAQRAGQNANALIQRGIATGIGNVLLNIGTNGKMSLPADTDENKMLRTADGWLEKLRTSAVNYTSQDDGFSYHNKLWPAMIQSIDPAYRADKGLGWLGSDDLATRWLSELSGMEPGSAATAHHLSKSNSLGAQILQGMGSVNPLGKPYTVAPQIGVDRPSTEGYAGTVPTSITDNGDGTLTININTLAGSGVDRSSTGTDGQRYVTIGCVSTGLTETIAVAFSTPNNTVTTSSLLGQTSASTTAADYFVKWADTTSLLLGPLRMMMMVVQNGIRIYTVFYPRDEVLEIIVHADVDYVVVDPNAFSLVDDIIAPRFDIVPS